MSEDRELIEVTELTERNCNEMLEDVIYELYGYKLRGIKAFYNFEGTKIYSSEITGQESIDKIFKKVYGCSYGEHVTKKANKMRPIWLKKGYEILSPDRHEKWQRFVDEVVESISFYHSGNPIEDTLILIPKINSVSNPEELENILSNIGGSHNVLLKTAIAFSDWGEIISKLYEEKGGNSRK